MTATHYPVVKLTADVDYHHLNHVCHLDNWYGQPLTCIVLLARGIHTNGTCLVNRKGLPKEGIFPKKGKFMRPKGTVKCMVNADNTLFFTAWQDNKPVHILSTIRPNLMKIQRISSVEGWKRVKINSHSLIKAYNFVMG